VTISVLVDTNVLVDVFRGGAASAWSKDMLSQAGSTGALVVNQVIWSEIAAGFSSETQLRTVLAGLPLQRLSISYEAAFVAGKAHAAYRARGGGRERTLPDFLIGAHATVDGLALLTRDASRYRTYFPDLEIIAPDTHQ
jgi:predicted nucleic acid-binding protein